MGDARDLRVSERDKQKFWLALHGNDLDALRTLVAQSPGLLRVDYGHHNTAIKAASYLGDARVLKLLLDCGAEADYCTSSSPTHWTALHRALRSGEKEKVELLLAHGADPLRPWNDTLPVDLAANEECRALILRSIEERKNETPSTMDEGADNAEPESLEAAPTSDAAVAAAETAADSTAENAAENAAAPDNAGATEAPPAEEPTAAVAEGSGSPAPMVAEETAPEPQPLQEAASSSDPAPSEPPAPATEDSPVAMDATEGQGEGEGQGQGQGQGQGEVEVEGEGQGEGEVEVEVDVAAQHAPEADGNASDAPAAASDAPAESAPAESAPL